jgi:small-conductance mechanosensitive channel
MEFQIYYSGVEKMVKWRKFFLAGLSAAAISYTVNSFVGYLYSGLYRPESGLWKAMLTPTWVQNVILANLLAGFILVIGYIVFNSSLGNKKQTTKKGLKYGLLVWLIKDVIGFTMAYVILAIPGMIIASWLVAGFIINLFAGLAIAKIYR